MLAISILSSILAGSALGRAISNFLVLNLKLNFYSGSVDTIPAFSEELAIGKTYDIVDFVLTIIFTLTIFALVHFFYKNKNKLISVVYLIFSAILFLQIQFATYNLVYVVIYFVAANAFFAIATKTKVKIADIEKIDEHTMKKLAEGLFIGFLLMLVIERFTSTILPLAAIALTPLVYYIFAKNRKPFLPGSKLYAIIIIILIVYNPLYYLGHFDSVEEGFWLGWVSGLRDGKALYSQIAAYHPPLIIWILSIFQKLFGYSIENTRLALHTMQIAGIAMYYFFADRLLKSRLSKATVMLLAISMTAIMVRNNVEIRLGLGLVSIAFLSNPVLAGGLAAAALFTSTEVGVAAFVAAVIYIVFAKEKAKYLVKYISGASFVAAPILLIILINGGMVQMITDIGFYIRAFSAGYFNLAIERPVSSSFIYWHLINQYLSAYPFLWEIARGGIVAALLLSISKFNIKKLGSIDQTAIATAIFALVVFRSALGRSDYYHLLFPLLVAIPLMFYVLEKIGNKFAIYAVSFFLLFVFARDIVNASFVNAKLYQLQTYGRAIGEQEPLLPNDEIEVVQFIKENTSESNSIFVYPWNPEIYFLTERQNATRHYTPYAFFSEEYQQEMISELEANNPKYIIYNSEMKFNNMTPGSLPIVDDYILENFEEVESFGSYKIMASKSSI
jgi:hypothetical protein